MYGKHMHVHCVSLNFSNQNSTIFEYSKTYRLNVSTMFPFWQRRQERVGIAEGLNRSRCTEARASYLMSRDVKRHQVSYCVVYAIIFRSVNQRTVLVMCFQYNTWVVSFKLEYRLHYVDHTCKQSSIHLINQNNRSICENENDMLRYCNKLFIFKHALWSALFTFGLYIFWGIGGIVNNIRF